LEFTVTGPKFIWSWMYLRSMPWQLPVTPQNFLISPLSTIL